MTNQRYFDNLEVPKGPVDVILDTDAYNEIDDQFAIAYLMAAGEKLHIKAFCAAPFLNAKAASPADGMRKSYDEILKLLKLAGREGAWPVYAGSHDYLPDENTPVASPAAEYMAKLADAYSPEKPLYIVAIGAITNVASAILMNPNMKENTVIVWLGGAACHVSKPASEFNMVQDIAAARVVLGCGVPVVMLPCAGVVDRFATSRYELEHWLKGKSPLCDYLAENAIQEAESYAAGRPWTRVIWDVTAVAWLLNENNRFMQSELRSSIIPEYDLHYATDVRRHMMRYVYWIDRDALFEDLFNRLATL